MELKEYRYIGGQLSFYGEYDNSLTSIPALYEQAVKDAKNGVKGVRMYLRKEVDGVMGRWVRLRLK